jgi:hypothetical protein
LLHQRLLLLFRLGGPIALLASLAELLLEGTQTALKGFPLQSCIGGVERNLSIRSLNQRIQPEAQGFGVRSAVLFDQALLLRQ